MSELRQRRPIPKRRERLPADLKELEREAQERFKRDVLSLDHRRCIGSTAFTSQHRCTGPLQAHHCVKQQTLRLHVLTIDLTPEELIEWVWTASIGATICRGLHAAHTAKLKAAKPFAIPFEWLPARVIDYCAALDPPITHLLTREHPPFGEAVC